MVYDRVILAVPFTVCAQDYHEFMTLRDFLKQLNTKIKYVELDQEEYQNADENVPSFPSPYLALFYVGRRPDKETIVRLLSTQKTYNF